MSMSEKLKKYQEQEQVAAPSGGSFIKQILVPIVFKAGNDWVEGFASIDYDEVLGGGLEYVGAAVIDEIKEGGNGAVKLNTGKSGGSERNGGGGRYNKYK